MSYIQYRKKDGCVVSISEDKLNPDSLGEKKIDENNRPGIISNKNNAFMKKDKLEITKRKRGGKKY